MAKNYYDILGVPKNASEKDIRSAYRRLARQYHPDVNRGDESAEAKFKEINEAYQVLSNADSRKKYDRFGENWRHAEQYERAGNGGASPFEWFTSARRSRSSSSAGSGGSGHGFSGGFGLGDLLGDLFGSGGGVDVEDMPTTRRAEVPVTLTLEEAYSGTKRMVEVPGDPFAGTESKRLEVSIPTGVRSGSRVRIGTRADDGTALDLYLQVTVQPHRLFERKGDDLHVMVDVPFVDLVLGGEVEVPTITGKKVALKIPAGTQNGKVFRLTGKGMPRQRKGGSTHGDELVTVRAVLPTSLSPEQRKLFEQLRAAGGQTAGAPSTSSG